MTERAVRSNDRPVLLLAPLCRDEIVRGAGRPLVRAGGAGLYASWALAELGAKVILHTPLAEKDQGLLRFLPPAVEVVVHPSSETTFFRIESDACDPNHRTLSLLAASSPLCPDRIGDLSCAGYALLGPLLPGDLTGALLEVLGDSALPIDLGAQGLVRRIDDRSRVVAAGAGSAPALPALRILSGDEEEIARLAGSSGPEDAMEILAERVAREVIATRGDRGARIRLRGRAGTLDVEAARPPSPPIHPVGLGDTFLAVYGWCRDTGEDPETAGARAARAAAGLLASGIAEPRSLEEA